MNFHQLDVPFWIILLSYAVRQSYGRWEPKIDVIVTNGFLDQRHITIVCQSFTKTETKKSLLKDLLMFPGHGNVEHKVETFSRDTVHRCMMVWQHEGTGQQVSSIFETFSGSWDHDVISVWDHEDKSIKYKWSVSESGLSLYSYSLKEYCLRKPLKSIQFIGVYIRNGLQHGSVHGSVANIHIFCTSNQPEGQGQLILVSGSLNVGELYTWSVVVFDVDTVQSCKVSFHGKIDRLSFEAFLGNWHHDDSIWNEEKKERRYDWIVKDNGLFVHNFETRQDEFSKALPSQ